ncbi:hypothetical protein QYM36_010002 [Artemia franciscana]|uniref:Uncharacterized protein n=1 Tax=Artemia franciscana TaxID=6661 RepID=A0AA88HS36_ARTSF|nr:hypothetical protein QYM36_010002 [Artemia franciscana]
MAYYPPAINGSMKFFLAKVSIEYIPLCNELGQPLGLPSIFVHIKAGDSVPDERHEITETLMHPTDDTEANTPKLDKSLIKSASFSEDSALGQAFVPPEFLLLSLREILEAESVFEKRNKYKKEIKQVRSKSTLVLSSEADTTVAVEIDEREIKKREKEIALKTFESFWKNAFEELKLSHNKNLTILKDWLKKTMNDMRNSIDAQIEKYQQVLVNLVFMKNSVKCDEIKSRTLNELFLKFADVEKLDECYKSVKDRLEDQYKDIESELEKCKKNVGVTWIAVTMIFGPMTFMIYLTRNALRFLLCLGIWTQLHCVIW